MIDHNLVDHRVFLIVYVHLSYLVGDIIRFNSAVGDWSEFGDSTVWMSDELKAKLPHVPPNVVFLRCGNAVVEAGQDRFTSPGRWHCKAFNLMLITYAGQNC